MSDELKLLRKIVPRLVMEIDIDTMELKGDTPLYSVFGIVTNIKEGKSDYGSFTKLIGSFEAVRAIDRARFQAPTCFLPEPLQGMIVAKVIEEIDASTVYAKDAKTGEPVMEDGHPVVQTMGRAAVRFAAEVGVKPSRRKGGAGYEYTVKPIVQAAANDALAELRSAALAALPNPDAKRK